VLAFTNIYIYIRLLPFTTCLSV